MRGSTGSPDAAARPLASASASVQPGSATSPAAATSGSGLIRSSVSRGAHPSESTSASHAYARRPSAVCTVTEVTCLDPRASITRPATSTTSTPAPRNAAALADPSSVLADDHRASAGCDAMDGEACGAARQPHAGEVVAGEHAVGLERPGGDDHVGGLDLDEPSGPTSGTDGPS